MSVGSHEGADPLTWYANPNPPVEFFARGVDLDVAWIGGGTMKCTGNSFAAPHIAGMSALVLAKHPELTPFQLKSVLYLTADNMGGKRMSDATLRAATSVGSLPRRTGTGRCSSRSSTSHGRSSTREPRPCSCSTTRRTSSCSRPSRATGEQELVGVRLPSSTGIAAGCSITGQPLVVDDLAADLRFAQAPPRRRATSAGRSSRSRSSSTSGPIGVLEVLDRPTGAFRSRTWICSTLFAQQAAIALDLLRAACGARHALDGTGETAVVARLRRAPRARRRRRRRAALLEALERVLARRCLTGTPSAPARRRGERPRPAWAVQGPVPHAGPAHRPGP